MLETIAIILIVLWLLGVVSGYTLGNFIYVLLVIAIVLFLVRLVSGRVIVHVDPVAPAKAMVDVPALNTAFDEMRRLVPVIVMEDD